MDDTVTRIVFGDFEYSNRKIHMEIMFKEIRETDYENIARLYNYYVRHSTATYHVAELSVDDTIDCFELCEKSTYGYAIRAGVDTAGFCLLRRYSKKEGYRYTSEISVYLDERFTNAGIGTRAIVHLDSVAKDKGIRTIVAGICAENIASIKLFEKNNYVRCGYFQKMGFKFGRDLDNVYYQKLIGQ
jgi:L-amino acid N-acyltransferase YncA